MKKLLYLCAIMILCINTKAQINLLEDNNWRTLFFEDFTGNRGWSNLWEDQNLGINNYSPLWKCFADEYWNSGVISRKATHLNQAYQKDNVSFNNGNLVFHGEFVNETPLSCGSGYVHAPWVKYNHFCDTPEEQHKSVFYHSGIIESIDKIRYGYFEIRCKLPYHPGSFPAFWLYDNSCIDNYYEEIDIMEYSYSIGSPNKYSSGFLLDKNSCVCPAPDSSYGNRHDLPTNTDITDWQIYACEWTPGRIVWYLNGQVVDEFFDLDSVPRYPLTLIANYAINNIAVEGNYPNQTPIWRYDDYMIIDYIKVSQLKCDCMDDVYITDEYELAGFDHQVKRSVEIGSPNGINALQTTNVTIRASDHIIVSGPFEVPIGAKLTMMVHPCPYPENDLQ